MKLDLRVFAECGDDAQAGRMMDSLCKATAALSPIPECAPVRYWKMPELFEFCIRFEQSDEPSFNSLLNRQHIGWVHGGDSSDRWSVWNRTDAAEFLIPETVWAEVQFYSLDSPS